MDAARVGLLPDHHSYGTPQPTRLRRPHLAAELHVLAVMTLEVVPHQAVQRAKQPIRKLPGPAGRCTEWSQTIRTDAFDSIRMQINYIVRILWRCNQRCSDG